MDRQERIRDVALTITGAWEGGHGYATYQTYDSGVISYGRFQFTLAAGSLWKVVETYLKKSQSDVAKALQPYATRIEARDAGLRDDDKLKEVLIKAADEEIMREAQNSVVIARYWTPSQDSVNSRGVTTALGQALFFDMAVQHGPANKHIQTAEANLGAPPKSHLSENGLTEHQLITETALVRQDFLDRFATKHNLPGVRKRGNFWVEMVNKGDWDLLGDDDGNVLIYGKPVHLPQLDGDGSQSKPVAIETTKPAESVKKSPIEPEIVSPVSSSTSNGPSISTAPTIVSSKTEVLKAKKLQEAASESKPASATTTPVESAVDGEVGEPYKGSYIAKTGVNIRDKPDTSGKKVASLPKGGSTQVKRRYAPSETEEWYQTAYGWVARLHPSSPDEVFGEVTPN